MIVPQLMSELVRKAETDIDALRRRLAGLGAAGELTMPGVDVCRSQHSLRTRVGRLNMALGRGARWSHAAHGDKHVRALLHAIVLAADPVTSHRRRAVELFPAGHGAQRAAAGRREVAGRGRGCCSHRRRCHRSGYASWHVPLQCGFCLLEDGKPCIIILQTSIAMVWLRHVMRQEERVCLGECRSVLKLFSPMVQPLQSWRIRRMATTAQTLLQRPR